MVTREVVVVVVVLADVGDGGCGFLWAFDSMALPMKPPSVPETRAMPMPTTPRMIQRRRVNEAGLFDGECVSR